MENDNLGGIWKMKKKIIEKWTMKRNCWNMDNDKMLLK